MGTFKFAGVMALAWMMTGCTALPDAQRATVQGGMVEYRVAGQGRAVVVFQAGLGDGAAAMGDLAARVSRDARTVVWSRPGYGGSAPIHAPRDACQIADEQRAMLKAAGVAPPYVLVGHSLGGLYQYVYARRYPEEVAALVLLDATHPHHWATMQQEAPAMAAVIKGARLLFRPVMAREFDDQAVCLDSLPSAPALQIPVRFLARGEFPVTERGDFEAMVKRLQRDWLALTGAKNVEVVRGAGHYLHKDKPDEVARVIKEVAREVGLSAVGTR